VRPFQDGRSSSSYQILGRAGKGVYDPIRRRLLLMGTGASDGSGQNSGFGAYQYNTLAIFDEVTNAWSALRAFRDPGEGTGARAIGHIYDGNAIDVAGRRLYKPKFGDDGESYIYVYDLDSGAMRAGIPRSPGTTQQNWASLEFIPTRGAAGRLWFAAYASSDALRIWEYDVAGGTWSLIVANAAFGVHGGVDPGGGPMMSYSARANGGAGGVLVGHRGGAWIANVVGTPTLTAIALPPSGPIDIAVSGVVRDPVGSGWLRFAGGSTVHRWNGSAWVAVATTGTGPGGDFAVYPLDEYGAVYIVHTSNIAANPTVGRVFKA